MNRERFQLALEQLRPAQWEMFEGLASTFLVDDYPNLRTLASPSGDGGRDGTLWGSDGEEETVFQYSVAADWDAKVRRTVRRLQQGFPNTRELVYVTNQLIGSQADPLRKALRKDFGVRLDVRDANWFAERVNSTVAREAAAERLAAAIVDPFLSSASVFENKAPALDSNESRAALVHLNLQWENDTREKGLTKLSFDALVRSALRGTDSENRVARAEVYRRVRDVLPGHEATVVQHQVDTALARLEKRFIRHWRSEDEFCLTHEEKTRVADKLAQLERNDQELRADLRAVLSALGQGSSSTLETLVGELRETLDRYFLARGERFAALVTDSGRIDQIDESAIADAVAAALSRPGADSRAEMLASAAQRVLEKPSPQVHAYLRSIADAYTLLAFLRETPDVQSAVVKMFSGGEVWLDASMVLPLFAEELLDEDERVYSSMIAAAVESGMSLYVTEGVLEEVVSHMHNCMAMARGDVRSKRTPYLFAAFMLAGRATGAFASWLELFRGDSRPLDDIAGYLGETFGIHRANLTEAEKASTQLRAAVQRLWLERHEKRRGSDSETVTRLANHDVENYLGVVVRRQGIQRDSPLGYKTWWVTLDRFAYRVRQLLEAELPASEVPASPVMSPDFLVSYLAIGPMRSQLSKASEARLPLAVSEMAGLDLVPAELLDLARAEREKMHGMPERVIRRHVRDALDARRRASGPVAEAGMDKFAETLASERMA